MNINVIEQNEEKIVLECELNEKEWNEKLQETYEVEKGRYKVEGFRPGKAPRKVIESQYGESVFFENAFNDWVAHTYVDYLNEHKDIKPMYDHPHFDIEKLEKNGVKVTMTIDLYPKIELGQYKGIEIKKEEHPVTDEQVDAELKRLAESFAENVDKGGDTQVENGDIAVIDFTGTIDGEPFDGGSDEDFPLTIGSHSFIDTFEDQLIGLKQGETKEVKVKFPENYGAKNLAGKDAVFYTTIKNIQTKQLPEMNDEFASKVGKFENFETLKSFIKSQLENRAIAQSNQEAEAKLLKQIVESSKINVSETLIEHQLDAMMHDMEYRLMYQGLTLDQYLEYTKQTKEDLRKNGRQDAIDQVKTRLVMQKIIEDEKITVSNDEIDKKMLELASQAKKTLAEFKKSMQKDQLDYIINDIIVNKFYDYLVKENKIN